MTSQYVWTQLTPSGGRPTMRVGHVSWVVGNYAYVFGGYTIYNILTGQYTLPSDLFWRYDLNNNAWLQLSDSGPERRHGASAWALGSDLYLFGGIGVTSNGKPVPLTATGTLDDLWVYNTATNQWSDITPISNVPGRSYAATWQYGENLYIAGGTSNIFYPDSQTPIVDYYTYPSSLKDTWVFNSTTQIWTQLSDAFYRFYGASSWLLGSDVFINVGIRDDNTAIAAENNHIFKFDLSTNAWISQTSVTFRAFAASGTFNNQGFLISGEIFQSFRFSPAAIPNDMYVFNQDLSYQRVTINIPGNISRLKATVWATSNGLYLFGGGYALGNTVNAQYNDLWVLTPTMQLLLSDWLSNNTVSVGDPYTIFWSSQIINPTSDATPIVNVTRPEEVSSNHYGSGQIQETAPLIPSDYPILITLCVSDVCISDVLILHVKQLVISAGSDRTINYGQSTQLGSPSNDPTIIYSWLPSDTLNNPSSDQPTATPLTTTTYTVTAFEADINKTITDNVTITVVVPIAFSDVKITPNLTCVSGGQALITWNITPSLPTPNYHINVARSDGTIIWSSFYSSVFSGVASDTAPTTPGVYPYYLSVVRNDYGQLSDNIVVNLTVVNPHITVAAIPNPTSIADPYEIQWTASLTNGQPSDTLTVTVFAPDNAPFVSDCLNGVTCSSVFQAPATISDFLVTVTAAYDTLPSCSGVTTFTLRTKYVAVSAGSDQTINYGDSIALGAGIADADVDYTWSPSYGLNTTIGLNPIATPLSDTTYTVVAFRSDVNRYASDSVTIHVIAPIALTDVVVSPTPTAPNTPITISWSILSDGPAPALSYHLIIQRSDGSSIIDTNGYTALSGTFSDLAPSTAGNYPYTVTVIRDDFGSFSDSKTVSLAVTQVTLSDVKAITNPTPTGDPYLIQWTVSVQNPQPSETVTVKVYHPDDESPITQSFFSANYHHGEIGSIPAIAPHIVSDYPITITASDPYGSFYSTTIVLRAASVTVDAGPDQTISYGSSIVLGQGVQESDIVYIWTPSDTLNTPNGLNPIASPLVNTSYTVLASRDFTSGVAKYDSDSVMVNVVAPITFSSTTISPTALCASSGGTFEIDWAITQSDPVPNYQLIIQNSDGGTVWSSDYNGFLTGSVILPATNNIGLYPYFLSVIRTDYGQLSDQAVVILQVVQTQITAAAVPNPTPTEDPYEIQWTATALGGQPSDVLTVTIFAPGNTFVSDCISGVRYTGIFTAPIYVSDYPVLVTAVYDAISDCTANTTFTLHTKFVAVDAGSDQRINYGDTVTLGLGLEEPDIIYTWSPNYALSSTTGLHPLAAPLFTTTYTVLAFRSDLQRYASDSVTITVVAPITIEDVQIAPTPTAPGLPVVISWNLVNSIPTPPLNYQAILQRSDGSIVSSTYDYTSLSGTISDTAPLTPGVYPYMLTVIRSDYGQLSDQKSAVLNVTQVFLSDVKAITNPTTIGDPYIIQWTVYADNPQPKEIVTVDVTIPDDHVTITAEKFTALYSLGKTGSTTAVAPDNNGFYTITVNAFDEFGSSDTAIISLETKDFAVDAGPDQTINYGSSTVLGVGLQESDVVYTWSPSGGLSATDILHPLATPLTTTTYTLLAFRSDLNQYASDQVTIQVINLAANTPAKVSYQSGLVFLVLVIYFGIMVFVLLIAFFPAL